MQNDLTALLAIAKTAAQAAADQINTRHNLHMYLLENTTQSMIDAQQLRDSGTELMRSLGPGPDRNSSGSDVGYGARRTD